MFTSGFTMNPSVVAETMEGETMTWLKELAKTLHLEVQLLYDDLAKLEKPQSPLASDAPMNSLSQIKPADLLLAWLIKFPNLLESLSEELEPDFFSDPRAGQFYKNLIVYYHMNSNY